MQPQILVNMSATVKNKILEVSQKLFFENGIANMSWIATIEIIHADYDDKVHIAVTSDDDPGRICGGI